MPILANRQTRVICQGITGKAGQFHTRNCIDYGSQVVGGVTPGKGGAEVEGVPVFDTVADFEAALQGMSAPQFRAHAEALAPFIVPGSQRWEVLRVVS